MSSRALAVLVACGVLGLALLVGVKREAIGDFVRFQIDANQAVDLGNQALRDIKIDSATYRHTATITYTFDEHTNEYLRRTIGIAAANRVYREQVPSAFWTIRYFRDSQNEEYMVVLRPDGSLHSVHHTLDEKASGANLSKDDALARAENYLRDRKNMHLSGWRLVDAQTDKKPARTDHTFEWEQNAALDPGSGQQDAHIRMQLHVQGDEVSGYRIFIKIPEAWLDEESRTTGAQLAQTFGRWIGLSAFLIAALVIFLRNLRHPDVARVPWRRLGKWSIWMFVAAVVIFVNRLPQLLTNYTTVMPLVMYYAILAITMIFAVSLYLAAAVLSLGISWFFLERAFGPGRIPGWAGMKAVYYRDAFCVAIFGSAAVLGLNRLPALLARWPALHHALGSSVPGGLDALNPAAGVAASAIVASFLTAGIVGLAVGIIAIYVRTAWMRAGVLILYAALMATNVATPGAFVHDAAFRLLTAIVLWFGATRIVRFNVMGYFLLASTMALATGAVELIQQPNPFFHANGYAVVAFAIALLSWPIVYWRRQPE
jgi:hypothetical protein